MKGKKQKKKVIPHCYRRNLSRTLSNSSLSQLVQIGSYKKRINDLARNNRTLAAALQEARLESAVQNNILQDCAKDCNKILFARLKLNEMAKNLAKFVTDLEEVRSYLDVDILTDLNNPFAHKKGSLNNRICKEPNVNCIEEVTEEYSENEIVAAENSPIAPDTMPTVNSNDKRSDVLPCNSVNNVVNINEDIEMAPILFADDSEDKKKKSSNKGRSSKISSDPDKGSLTPELNIDLTCVKLKRKSSRRHTQFLFPGSRSTSRGKTTEKENSPEELATPVKPASPQFTHQEQVVVGIEKTTEENAASPMGSNVRDKEQSNSPESCPQPVLNTNQCDPPIASIINPAKNLKNVVAPGIQPGESNSTVLLCEDMELTDIIRPAQQIIIENTPLSAINSLDNAKLNCDGAKEMKENGAFCIPAETQKEDIGEEIISEIDSAELFQVYPSTSEQHKDDDPEVLEINEQDEVQNVGMITFCDDDDQTNNGNQTMSKRSTKSSLIRHSRRANKPIKYAVFFSSDESEEDSPFEISTNKSKNSKRKTVISTKIGKSSVSHRKISQDENEILQNDIISLLNSEKDANLGKKSFKKSKDLKNSCKKDLPKQASKKVSTASNDEHFKINEIENTKKLMYSPFFSPSGILKKKQPDPQITEEIDKEAPLNKIPYNDNLDDSIESAIETPRSESRKVSFAPTDLVCNFRRMSVSKKIAENKKVRRASKSYLDFEELFEEETKTITSHAGADNFSESTNAQKENDPVLFNFSGDTELYTFPIPTNNFPPVLSIDDLTRKSTVSLKITQKDTNKNDKHLKKVLVSKPVKASGKLSLKKNKDPKNTEPPHTTGEKLKEMDVTLFESPLSVCKPAKRKSLFKEHLDDDSKENINVDQPVLEKPKHISQEKDKAQTNKNSELSAQDNCTKQSSSKRLSKIGKKVSMKKLSDKPKPTPEMKKKKHSVAVKSIENSPVLKDTVNLPEVQDGITSKRRSKQVSYKEPSLHKKMRRQ